MINIGERTGFLCVEKQGWSDPQITESFEPKRISVSLVICKTGDKKATIKTAAFRYAIIEYLTENVTAKSSEIAELIGLKQTRTKEILKKMIGEGIIITEGENKNRIYKLKS